MINWITEFWNWLLSLFSGKETQPIKIGEHCYMPLFPSNATHGIMMTWGYLSWTDAKKKACRDAIKAGALPGETPAITFCLTPHNINGGLVEDSMLAVGDDALDWLELKCKELIEDGIAVFPCLYVDDAAPRWWEIEKHVAVWKRVHERIKKYVTGYILSIETNEHANNVAHIDGCMVVMRSVMPGVDFYGTHLQWKSGGRYSWNGGNVPKSANIILAEFSWDPNKGDAVGLQPVKNEFYDIQRANPALKWVAHEINVNADSATGKAQTAWLRSAGAWGVA